MNRNLWPSIPYAEWKETCTTLHLLTQMMGKIRLARTPWINHSWHVTLYLTTRGLTTSPIPHGPRLFQLQLDLIDHELRVETGEGAARAIQLRPRPVAEVYAELMARLADLDLQVRINTRPSEIPDGVPFDRDYQHAAYDADHARRFFRALAQADRVLKQFRARFCGKCSPVHFFWGSFDLAVTRFSGRRAPPHPGGIPALPDSVTREAYSHEVSSAGFWPGGEALPYPLFYSYAYPEPAGFAERAVRPAGASYLKEMGEFVLPYEEVCRASDPDALVLEFLQSTYETAAELGRWDRAELEQTGDPR